MAVRTQNQRQRRNDSNKVADFFRSLRKRLDGMHDGETIEIVCRPPIDVQGLAVYVYRNGFDVKTEGSKITIIATPPLEPWREELCGIYRTMYDEISALKPGEFLKLPELPEYVDLDKIYNWAIDKGFFPQRNGKEFMIARKPK